MSEARDNRDRISRRAHEIWEREGHPHGRHDEHWAQAQTEIEAEDAAQPTAASDAPRKSTAKGTRAAAETLSTVENGTKAAKTAKPSVAKPRAQRKDGGKGASPR